MSLRTWWIGVKLNRAEQKLKQLHSRQKRLRGLLEKLGDKGTDAQRAKLESDREKATSEVARLHAEAERLRAELKNEENGHASA